MLFVKNLLVSFLSFGFLSVGHGAENPIRGLSLKTPRHAVAGTSGFFELKFRAKNPSVAQYGIIDWGDGTKIAPTERIAHEGNLTTIVTDHAYPASEKDRYYMVIFFASTPDSFAVRRKIVRVKGFKSDAVGRAPPSQVESVIDEF